MRNTAEAEPNAEIRALVTLGRNPRIMFNAQRHFLSSSDVIFFVCNVAHCRTKKQTGESEPVCFFFLCIKFFFFCMNVPSDNEQGIAVWAEFVSFLDCSVVGLHDVFISSECRH